MAKANQTKSDEKEKLDLEQENAAPNEKTDSEKQKEQSKSPLKDNANPQTKEVYVVIVPFKDLEDGKKRYTVGDVYPVDGKSDKRIDELATNKNKRKKPLIKKIEV